MLIRTQKELKKELYRKKAEMTDEMLFSSRAYAAYQNTILQGCTKQYGQSGRVILKNMDPDTQAYTNGRTVYINLNAEVLNPLTRMEKNHFITGLNLHECGHLLFTDFALNDIVLGKLEENTIYPMPEESPERDDCLVWLIKNNAGRIITKFYRTIWNCIEDGHIEKRVMKAVPGYGVSLEFARKIDISEMRSVEQMRNDGLDDIPIVINMTLRYAKFRQTAFGNVPVEDPAIQSFLSIRPYIDKAIDTNNSFARQKAVNECFVRLYQLIADKIDQNKQDPSSDQSPDENPSNQASENGACGANGSDNGNLQSSNESPTAGNSSSPTPRSCPSKAEVEEVLGELESLIKEFQEKTAHDNTKELSPVSRNDSESESSGDESPSEIKSISSPTDPTSTDEQSGAKEQSGFMEALENKAAQELLAANQEKELGDYINNLLADVAHDNAIHRGIPFWCRRAGVTPCGEALYESEHTELDAIARKVMKNLLKEMEDRRRGDNLKGLYMGRRLDPSHLYRQDQKIFQKNILPENIPNMAIELLVDLSGSMRGERIDYSRKCAYITWTFCRMAGIPISVTGHHTSQSDVIIESFADPHSLDGRDGQRIMSMAASGCNRDGFAVRYCLNRLRKADADHKIMMIICDGYPHHEFYGIPQGKADLQDAVAKAKKEGILTVTAAIGSDTDSVKYIYTDGISEKKSAMFLEISDLERLPKTFVKLIKRHLE